MHNLAVLYAEGIDGKPDYKAASEWFLKAARATASPTAEYILASSMPAASALPSTWRIPTVVRAGSRQWRPEQAKKRDEVAARLDAKTMAAAGYSGRDLVGRARARRGDQPQAPPGGWDQAVGARPAAAAPSPPPFRVASNNMNGRRDRALIVDIGR